MKLAIFAFVVILLVISVAVATSQSSNSYNVTSLINSGGNNSTSQSYNASQSSIGQTIINKSESQSYVSDFGSSQLSGENTAPTVTAVLNLGSAITLAACDNVTVICNGTIDDPDGYANIASASAVLYHSSSTPEAADDPNTHYTNSSCGLLGGYATTKKDYTCTSNMTYYANNGTWTCNVTATDYASATATATNNQTLNALKAINTYENSVNFGSLAPLDISTPNKNVTVQNCGNIPFYLYLSGTSMTCDIVGSISYHYIRYDTANYTATYDELFPLVETPVNTNLNIIDTTTGTNSTGKTYWSVKIPVGTKGICSGNITFLAT